MKRLLQWLFRGVTVLSLLVGIATVVFWVRSYKTGDTLIIAHCGVRDNTLLRTEWAIVMGNGMMKFSRETRSYSNPPAEYVATYPPGWKVTPCANPPNWAERSFNGAWSPIGFRYGSQARTEYYDEKGNITVERWAVRSFGYAKSAFYLRCWLIVSLTAIPATICLIRRLIRHTPPVGHCSKCGYDLRASRERCPECGTPIPAVPSPTPQH